MAQRKRFSFIYNRITLIILVAFIGFMVLVLWQLAQKERDSRMRSQEVARELQEIEGRKQVLEQDLELLATPRGQETILRSTRDVARAGEEVYIILDPRNDVPTTTSSQGGLWDWFERIF